MTDAPHQLRRAEPGDAPAIAHLFLAARAAAMPWLPVLHDVAATVTFFRDVVPARAELWVEVAATGDLRGFIAFAPGEIEHLYVAPDHQRCGTGSRLLQLALSRGEPLELWAFRRNDAARAFYLRRGFHAIRETDGAGNEEREPDVRYRWEPQAAR